MAFLLGTSRGRAGCSLPGKVSRDAANLLNRAPIIDAVCCGGAECGTNQRRLGDCRFAGRRGMISRGACSPTCGGLPGQVNRYPVTLLNRVSISDASGVDPSAPARGQRMHSAC